MSWIIADAELRDPHFNKRREKIANDVYRGWDFRRSRASAEVQKRIWDSVTIRHVKKCPLAIRRYVDELRQCCPEWVQFAQFKLSTSEEFDLLASQRSLRSIQFCQRFLLHPAVREQMPDIARNAKFSRSVVFETLSSLRLDGVLAELLLQGWPYQKYSGTALTAKRSGAKVCRALFGDRYSDVDFFYCGNRWSDWFRESMWDSTILIVDYRLQVVSTLIMTADD